MFYIGMILFIWGVVDFASFTFLGYDVYSELFNIQLTGPLFNYSAYIFMLVGGLMMKFTRSE